MKCCNQNNGLFIEPCPYIRLIKEIEVIKEKRKKKGKF
jgi:hypothetical protein